MTRYSVRVCFVALALLASCDHDSGSLTDGGPTTCRERGFCKTEADCPKGQACRSASSVNTSSPIDYQCGNSKCVASAPCTGNQHCGSDAYCHRDYKCNVAGLCRPRTMTCYMNIEVVCTCAHGIYTLGNRCTAHSDGKSIATFDWCYGKLSCAQLSKAYTDLLAKLARCTHGADCLNSVPQTLERPCNMTTVTSTAWDYVDAGPKMLQAIVKAYGQKNCPEHCQPNTSHTPSNSCSGGKCTP